MNLPKFTTLRLLNDTSFTYRVTGSLELNDLYVSGTRCGRFDADLDKCHKSTRIKVNRAPASRGRLNF